MFTALSFFFIHIVGHDPRVYNVYKKNSLCNTVELLVIDVYIRIWKSIYSVAGCCQFCFRGIHNEWAEAVECFVWRGRFKEKRTVILLPLNCSRMLTISHIHQHSSQSGLSWESKSLFFHELYETTLEAQASSLQHQRTWAPGKLDSACTVHIYMCIIYVVFVNCSRGRNREVYLAIYKPYAKARVVLCSYVLCVVIGMLGI